MNELTSPSLVIVGAGHATGEMIATLRQEKYAGSILAVGEEVHIPYQRPPLSKGYLSGSMALEALHLRPRSSYETGNVQLLLGTKVDSIKPGQKHVMLADGQEIAYDKLSINTGGRARPLAAPGASDAAKCDNFHYVRTIEDIDRFRRHLAPGSRLIIIGGGYIGLEAAAVASKQGMQVTILEAASRILVRVTAPAISAFYMRIHQDAGVQIRTNVEVKGFEIDNGANRVTAVRFDGDIVGADAVIAGVGLIPNTELAQACGLRVDNGIVVNEFCQTSDPNIVSAGDCTNQPSKLYGRRIRLESVPNAVEQARTAALTLCNKPKAYDSLPWFWSDQYNLKLQMVGLSQGYEQLVLRGSTEGDSFSAFYLFEGRVIAADMVNRPNEFILAKRLVREKRAVDPTLLADESRPLKSIVGA